MTLTDTDEDHDDLIASLDQLHARISASQRRLFELIIEAERRRVWRDLGARDMAHWVSMRYGVSWWKADRWVRAAHALERLPRLSRTFRAGELGIDKVVELARFATADDEAALIRWARGVSPGRIRRKADVLARQDDEQAREADRSRFLSWWYLDEGRRMGLEAELPAADGTVVARAIEQLAERIPAMPDEEGGGHAPARRADALVALCSSSLGADPDPDRATVVVHAGLDAVVAADRGSEIEGGGVAHPQTVRRLLCSSRVQAVIEDPAGDPVGLGRTTREPSAWMMRQLRYRDAECRFPGCGARRFTQAHHILWWTRGGRTDLDNLLLVCTFHHRLVHEHGWSVRREPNGAVRWFRPDGREHHAGAAPSGRADGLTMMAASRGAEEGRERGSDAAGPRTTERTTERPSHPRSARGRERGASAAVAGAGGRAGHPRRGRAQDPGGQHPAGQRRSPPG